MCENGYNIYIYTDCHVCSVAMQTTEMYAYSDIFMFGEQFLNFVPIICLNDVEPTYLVTLLSWRACFI